MKNAMIKRRHDPADRVFEEAMTGLKAEKCLEIEYNDTKRLVELHAICVNEHGQRTMFVWQVSGGSRSGQSQGWKYIPLAGVTSLSISQQQSEAPRPGYQPVIRTNSSVCWFDLVEPQND